MGDVVEAATRRLDSAGVPGARREAELLLGFVLGIDRGGVIARRPDPIAPEPAARFETLLRRRERREPFQYLAGEQEFHGLVFRVDRRVLIPRPETEHLVDAVLAAGLPAAGCVLDVGTGSGCIAVALALARPDLRIVALDRSEDALAVAKENVDRHGVGARVECRLGDLASLPAAWSGAFDAVVSNPPYVSEAEWLGLAPEVRDWEPKDALVPGPTGNEAYDALAAAAQRLLRPGGFLAIELGFTTEAAARAAALRSGFGGVSVSPDLRGIPRVLRARRDGGAP